MKLKDIIADIDKLKKELERRTPMKEEYKSALLDKVRLEWTYHSCKLEGNKLTYGETRELLKHNRGAVRDYSDLYEIKGHEEAIFYLERTIQNDELLTEKFIRELNHKVLKEPRQFEAETSEGKPTTKTIYPGKYKTTPNHVKTEAGDKFKYAEPFEVEGLMKELMVWFREDDSHPLIKSAELHYRFLLIHPFDDGNGRVSRLLMNYSLINDAFPPVIISSNQKELYLSCLRKANAGEFDSLYEFLGNNLIDSLELYIAAAKGENINDYSDLDKELTVFYEKLSQDGKDKINLKRSKELISKRFEDSIWPFFDCILEKTKKFYDLFESHELNYMIDRTHFSGNFSRSEIKEKLQEAVTETQHLRELGIEIRLIAFKHVPENPRAMYLKTNAEFQDHLYMLNPHHNGNKELPEIRKLYDKLVSEEEIDEYVYEEGKAILADLKSYYQAHNSDEVSK